MLTRNIPQEVILDAATFVGVEVRDLRPVGVTGYRFTLAPMSRTFERRSHNGRRVHALCWHGHREFFRRLFELAPDGKVQTAQTRRFVPGGWYTSANFEAVYRATGDNNIGSAFSPMRYADACECDTHRLLRIIYGNDGWDVVSD